MVENEDGFYIPEPEPTPPPQISIVEPQPQPQATLPQPLMDKVDGFLSNPLFKISAKKYIPEIQKYIKDNSGDYESLVYDYISSKYPNVYSILKLKQDNESEYEDEYDDEDEDDTPRKPVPRAAINYEIFELAKEGYTPTEISDFLNEKYDRDDLLPMHIGRAIQRQRKAALTANKLNSIKQVTTTPTPILTLTPTPVLTTIPHKQDIKQSNIDSTPLVFIDTISSILWNRIKIYVFMSASLLAGFLIGRLS